ncbi:MAG: hypothetical protein ACKV22_37210 [Bryobacteraceae bacterium]
MVVRFIAAVLAASVSLWGAPALTTIQDTLFRADGTKFNGIVQITWTTFESGNTSFVVANSKTVRIVDGSLSVKLVPTAGTDPAAYYTVRYWGSGKVQFTETWSVPQGALPLRVRDVRTSGPLWPGGPVGSGGTAGNTEVEIADVNGLSIQLSNRPEKAGTLTQGVAGIDAGGKVITIAGSSNECIRVDGSTAPCGQSLDFVDSETPNGLVDGANAAFVLTHSPSPAASLMLFRNGLLQRSSIDYTLSGSGIQFVAAAIPQPGDVLVATYRK